MWLPGAVEVLQEMPEGQGWAGLSACPPPWSLAGEIPPAAQVCVCLPVLLHAFLIPSVFHRQKLMSGLCGSSWISRVSSAGGLEQHNPQQTSIHRKIPVPTLWNTAALCPQAGSVSSSITPHSLPDLGAPWPSAVGVLCGHTRWKSLGRGDAVLGKKRCCWKCRQRMRKVVLARPRAA